jgi:RNA polymerase sigma-70 factor (ECF subfamily)
MDNADSGLLERLLDAAARGDRQAFATLYARSSAKLFAVALRILKRRDRAEEVLQDAFLNIWNHAGDYRPERGAATTWMASIVRNRALDYLRRDRPQVSLDEAPGHEAWTDPGLNPLEQTLENAEARRIKACLDELDEKPRQAILKAYYEGLTHEELATRLEAPLGTIKSWVRRGLLRLKGCLER